MNAEKYYAKAKSMAYKFYKLYENTYSANMLEIDDLKQEALLTVWEVIEKYGYKPPKELNKIMNKAIENKLDYLRNESAKHNQRFIDLTSVWFEETSNQNECAFSFENIRNYLNKKQYEVMFGKIVEGKTDEELAKELHISHQAVNRIYQRARNKLQKELVDEYRKKT